MKKDKYSVVIIDDEEKGIVDLRKSLSNYTQFSLNGTTQNPRKGKDLIFEIQPDLLFLDVEMPEITGFDLLREIKDDITWRMQVVFYTAYDKYLLEALRESAFDYLLKPYEEEEFQIVINRFLEYAQNKEEPNSFKKHANDLYNKDNNSFFVTTLRGFRKIVVDEVGYFKYEDRTWHALLWNDECIHLKRNTKANDILKMSDKFVQISNQQIININHLHSIEGRKCILTTPFDKQGDLNISRRYLDSVQEMFYML